MVGPNLAERHGRTLKGPRIELVSRAGGTFALDRAGTWVDGKTLAILAFYLRIAQRNALPGFLGNIEGSLELIPLSFPVNQMSCPHDRRIARVEFGHNFTGGVVSINMEACGLALDRPFGVAILAGKRRRRIRHFWANIVAVGFPAIADAGDTYSGMNLRSDDSCVLA